MLRKFLYSITALSLVLFTASCEDTNGDNFGADVESGWVQYADDNNVVVVAPFQNSVEIPVELHTNVNKSGLEVTYVIEDIAGNSLAVLGGNSGVVTFKQGQLESSIVLNINTAELNGGYQFKVILHSANRGNVSMGAAESTPIEKTVCIQTVSAGNYVGEVYLIDNGAAPEYIAPFNTVMSSTDVEGIFNLSNGWGLFVPYLTGDMGHATYTNPLELDFTTTVNGSLVVNSLATYGTDGDAGVVGCDGSITYNIGQGLFTDAGLRALVVLTPAN